MVADQSTTVAGFTITAGNAVGFLPNSITMGIE
jgi:hypothetical protein